MSWLNSNQHSVPGLDKFDALVRIQRQCPALPAETRKQILRELEQEIRGWSPWKRSQPTFEQDWILALERICRETRERSVSSLEKRMRDSRDEYEPKRPLTRDDILRATAEMALTPIPFEYERRNAKGELDDAGEIAIVDLTSLNPKGEFTIARFDWNFFATDLRRLCHRLVLRDGHLCVRTTREISQNGRRIPRLVPIRSIVAALRYGQNYDSVFLTAESINGNLLDLRKENTRIPCLVDSPATAKENERFNDSHFEIGGSVVRRLTLDALFAVPTRVPVNPDDTGGKSWTPTQSKALQNALGKLSRAEARLKSEAACEEVVEQAAARRKKGERA